MRPPTVSVWCDDPITADGAAAALRRYTELELLPRNDFHADVVVLVIDDVTEDTLATLRDIAAARAPGAAVVLVAHDVRQRHLLRAIDHGVTSVVPRERADADRLVRAVWHSAHGRADLPAELTGWLVEHVRTIQRDVLAPRGLTPAGLEPRELEVVRLLADGLDTGQIAQRLNYSERTVKLVLHAMMARLRLRSRPHAVAHALRSGAL
jgi:DNA-binding NarL/FixJ family response regulator